MKNIVYFSSDEWSSGLKTSQYHLANLLSENNRVLYINSIGMRAPKLNRGDAKRIISKLSRFTKGCKHAKENLFVITPIVIPYHKSRIVRIVNQWLLFLYIKFYIMKLGMSNFSVITFLPNMTKTIKALKAKKILFYCADQLSKFEGVPEKEIIAMEEEIMTFADYTLVTSRKLLNEKNAFSPIYSPHGVDFELFNSATKDTCKIPDDIAHIKKPILGFYGHISNDWIDFGLLIKIAGAGDWSIVLIGKYDHDIPDLSAFANIHLLGSRPYETLPAYSKAFDVGIIPFNVNTLTSYCNPIKLKEYLAAGLPVVSTSIPEILSYKGNIGIAENHEEFISMLRSSLSQEIKSKVSERIDLVKGESWHCVAERVANLLNS